MFKIALTAGHYLYTTGKRCDKALDPNETREWWLNDRIADKIEQNLSKYEGYELVRTDDTTGETAIELDERVKKANDFKADFYLSIHHNAGIHGGSGGGIMAYVYTKVNDATREWQKALYDRLIAKTGLKGNRSTPLAASNLYECRETKMPAVLLELGFMDSSTDVPIILTETFANQCAEAITEVLVEKGGLIKKSEQKPQTAPQTALQTVISFKAGEKLVLNETPLYSSSTSANPVGTKTGTFYVWSDEIINGRIRITNAPERVGVAGQVTGYIVVTATETKSEPKPQPKPEPKPQPTATKKSSEEIAKEVLAGKWGNGAERKKKLTEAGYDYAEIQAIINGKPKTSNKKSVEEIAKEVIKGNWGSGAERKQRLTEAGYNYTEIQKKVNELLK